MAVGQTLRSPMRGARSLAERLRSRANTGAIWGGSGLLWWWFHGGFMVVSNIFCFNPKKLGKMNLF